MEKPGRQPTEKSLKFRLENLKEELAAVRSDSLTANRAGDFMKVARLTARAQQINGSIFEVENMLRDLDI
jgi:hypothetical protein